MDEESTKYDEEYDDLAMRENGYWSDDEQEQTTLMKKTPTMTVRDDDDGMKKAGNNLNLLLEAEAARTCRVPTL